jgi:hypothetical protein
MTRRLRNRAAQYTLIEALGSSLYRSYREIAIRERSTVVAVIRDVLRMNLEAA